MDVRLSLPFLLLSFPVLSQTPNAQYATNWVETFGELALRDKNYSLEVTRRGIASQAK